MLKKIINTEKWSKYAIGLRSFFARKFKKKVRKTPAQKRGDFGESLAARFLKKEKGFRILEKNWRSRRNWHFEIDIIARDGDVLVFIEVRARSENALISGYHSITWKKKRTLKQASTDYLRQTRYPSRHFRFDVVEVKLCNNGQNKINHHMGVPLFSKHFHITSSSHG